MSSMGSQARIEAIFQASQRMSRYVEVPNNKDGKSIKVSDYFGDYALRLSQIKNLIDASDWNELYSSIHKDTPLPRDVATRIASVVKDWAVARGATHFTHWFQPQTEFTAEKHDSFLNFDENQKPIDSLSASFLLQSEPDASSFPSGGLRATHEARGYTVWDPTSPLFVMENGNTKYLCIPSVFIGYNGEFLDERGPLLKSTQVLSEKALKMLHLLGDTTSTEVVTTLGPEQEYFAIDRAFYVTRPDLMMTGRTLIGARPPKGQQLEDHYFSSIPDRIQAFMTEVEFELYRLGVPVKTRHNEVAPSQYESAPVFEESDIATDHNQLTMTVLRRVAKKHDLEILLHEKPFAGINGSGKHCNWSMSARTMSSATGLPSSSKSSNLLDPGEDPKTNTRFLLFLLATLRGVQKHAGLLRAGIASAGNDHRLGANEAPPAIISAFLGQTLSRVLDELEGGSSSLEGNSSSHASTVNSSSNISIAMKSGIRRLPELTKDTTDRNRTSPFAFTGNKFEFRAVGGAATTAFPVMLLNVAVADGITEVTEALENELKKNSNIQSAAEQVIRRFIGATKSIRFEGNNYSTEWLQEAEHRGLPHYRKTPEALAQIISNDSIQTFEKLGVLNSSDLHARYHVRLETYIKRMMIEAKTLVQMVETMVLPAGFADLNTLTQGAWTAKQLGLNTPQVEPAQKLSVQLTALQNQKKTLVGEIEKAEGMTDISLQAKHLSTYVATLMEDVRNICDHLEDEIADIHWPLPRYREILFIS